MEQEIIVNDMSLALLLRDTLEKSGNRNPKYKQLDYKRFTPEELATITSLKLEGSSFEDISVLKYCTNLRELSIISENAKNVRTELSDEAKYNYLMRKNKITDFSVISDLTNLEFLTISFDENLKSLDLLRLRQLTSLKLDHNPNLIEVKGIDSLEELSELVLYSNSISHSFELPNMMKNGMLNDIKLDFDLYPILKQQYPNLDEALFEQQRYGVACKWQENLSNIRTTKYKKEAMSMIALFHLNYWCNSQEEKQELKDLCFN